jgi:hypothetical protein
VGPERINGFYAANIANPLSAGPLWGKWPTEAITLLKLSRRKCALRVLPVSRGQQEWREPAIALGCEPNSRETIIKPADLCRHCTEPRDNQAEVLTRFKLCVRFHAASAI